MRWVVADRLPDAENALKQSVGVGSLAAAILAQRGYQDPVDAQAFLSPDYSQLGDPTLLPDYALARDAILSARDAGDLIFVHGDYDVDGITSSAIFDRFLRKIGAKVQTHVPHRMREGYGIHASAVEAASQAGAKLFLTCDCGIAAHEPVRLARAAGMTVVVTDHHHVGEIIPEAHAVVNPHRSDSKYPFPDISGAGVVFRLCEGITRDLGWPVDKFRENFIDLAAIGTIADVMPLQGDNRVIAHFGLQHLATTRKPGLRALLSVADATPPFKSGTVGFQIGPRLNAAGRIDDAALALKLVLSNDDDEARELALQVDAVNTERRSQQQRMIEEAALRIEAHRLHDRKVILIADPAWHVGIVGIVAGRLVEQFRRPVFVMTVDEESGIVKGSGRSIETFHLAEAIQAHPELLSGGGHAMAAGMSFKHADFDAVEAALIAYADRTISDDDLIPVRRIDLEIQAAEMSAGTVAELSKLEPFGMGNPSPVFLMRDVELLQVGPTRKPEHVRTTLRLPDDQLVIAMAFGFGEEVTALEIGAKLDVVFSAEIDTWGGRNSLKWTLKDFRRAG